RCSALSRALMASQPRTRRARLSCPQRTAAKQSPTSERTDARPSEAAAATNTEPVAPHLPQTVGVNFLGPQLINDSGMVPPDSMGAVGPNQFFITVNGRVRTYTKAGVAD